MKNVFSEQWFSASLHTWCTQPLTNTHTHRLTVIVPAQPQLTLIKDKHPRHVESGHWKRVFVLREKYSTCGHPICCPPPPPRTIRPHSAVSQSNVLGRKVQSTASVFNQTLEIIFSTINLSLVFYDELTIECWPRAVLAVWLMTGLGCHLGFTSFRFTGQLTGAVIQVYFLLQDNYEINEKELLKNPYIYILPGLVLLLTILQARSPLFYISHS